MTDLRDRLQASLGESYRLDRELTGGGMSRVFVAHDTRLGRDVVVKVLSPDLAAGVNSDRFHREILVAAQLQHPQIVPVLAAGETDGLPYFTMPYVAGESLRRRLDGGKPLPVIDAVAVLRDVARALAYAHEHGVVHRDIKPDNVLVSGGSAAVTDFGAGVITSWNRAAQRMYGYTEADAVGQPIGLIVPPEKQAEVDEVLTSIRTGHTVGHFETTDAVRTDRRSLFRSQSLLLRTSGDGSPEPPKSPGISVPKRQPKKPSKAQWPSRTSSLDWFLTS